MKRQLQLGLVLGGLALGAVLRTVHGAEAGSGPILLPDMAGGEGVSEAVLFAFDDRAFPFRDHVETHLFVGRNPRVVLPPGPAGSHDEVVHYYGTVLRIGETFHMWYNGNFGPIKPDSPAVERKYCCLCYAVSDDGIHWRKPDLGLVEFNGSKHNNIVDFPDPALWSTGALLCDPQDPAADRRYKMAYEAGAPGSLRFRVAFSPDGIHWRPSPRNPVGPFLEMAGVIRRNGLYYVYGQGDPASWHRRIARRLTVFASSDFETWSPCGAVGLDRAPDVSGPSTEDQQHQLEEVHLGAAVWNRGNVLLGIYGQWHGNFSGERRLVTMDLGLAISHDGIHFEEPIRDFRLVPAREQPGNPIGLSPALIQGQGMENVGDQTLYWYSLWRAYGSTGVSVVSWPRDRLGALEAFSPANPRTVSCVIRARDAGEKVFVNASGLGKYTSLSIGLMDEGFHPLGGFSGDGAAKVSEDGFHRELAWGGGGSLPAGKSLRLDVRFEGIRPEDARLHAIYIGGAAR